MNPQLKEKMQKSAEEYLIDMQEGGCIPNFEEDDFNSGNLYGAEKGFMKGSEAMYAELVPLVEWVSVDYDLPFEDKSDIIYLVKWWNEKDSKHFFAISSFDHIQEKFTFEVMSGRKITHWRRIEL